MVEIVDKGDCQLLTPSVAKVFIFFGREIKSTVRMLFSKKILLYF